LSLSGPAAPLGLAQERSLRLFESQLRTARGIYGVPVEFVILDDGSSPLTATRQVRALLEAHAPHTLICCTTDAASLAIVDLVEQAGVLTLALSSAEAITWPPAERFWLFSTKPNNTARIRTMVLDLADQGAQSLALMALDNSFGEVAVTALTRLLAPGGLRLVATERYPPDVTVLTPEALWVATRQPGGVLVWGTARDTGVAVDALVRRGYAGPIYVSPSVVNPFTGIHTADLEGVLSALDAITVAASLPPGHVTAAETRRYLQLFEGRYGRSSAVAAGGAAWDAALVLQAALREAFAYGVSLAHLQPFRFALRDAIIGMGPVVGATAVFDYREGDHLGIVPRSLVIAQLAQGTWRGVR
jgi:branched-chain amino acid transport system substrate-binding protein